MPSPIKNNRDGNIAITSNQIIWQGPYISCIDLSPGDTVSTVIYNIACKLCELIESVEDLKTLDLSCVIDLCVPCQNDVDFWSIKNILQLLLNNDCKLKDLIDQLNTTSSSTELSLTVNLGCIEQELINICGVVPDILPPDKVIQAIINRFCETSTQLSDLNILYNNIQTQLSNLILNNGTYVEPDIISCLSSTPTLLSTHLSTITDPAICEIKDWLGTKEELDLALSGICLNDYPVDLQNPQNVAELLSTYKIVFCDLLEQIQVFKTTCGKYDCDDIKIGFNSTFDLPSLLYTLNFNQATGTSIPAGFIDCGSTYTLTDINNQSLTLPIPGGLSNNTSFTVDISSLDYTAPIDIKITTCFSVIIPGNKWSDEIEYKCSDCITGKLSNTLMQSNETCWVFRIPKNANITKNYNYTGLHYRVGLSNTSTVISGNADLVSPSGLPINVVQCSFVTTNANYNDIVLKFIGMPSSHIPTISLKYTEPPITYPEIHIKGTLVTCTC